MDDKELLMYILAGQLQGQDPAQVGMNVMMHLLTTPKPQPAPVVGQGGQALSPNQQTGVANKQVIPDSIWRIATGHQSDAYNVAKAAYDRMKNVGSNIKTKIDPKAVTTSIKNDLQSLSNQPGQIVSYIRKYFPKEQWDNAYKIAMAESGLNPKAVGDTTLTYQEGGKTYGASYGPFQIRHLPGRPDPNQLLNPEFNVKYAANLLKANSGRWSPTWSAATKLGIY